MQYLNPEQLKAQLERDVSVFYLLFGQDQLLLQECLEMIRQAADSLGPVEKYQLLVDAKSDWQEIRTTCQTMTLFAQRRLVQLTFVEGPPTASQREKLAAIAPLISLGLTLVVVLPNCGIAERESSWFKLYSHYGICLDCRTPNQQQLPKWILRRCAVLGLYPDRETVVLLCYHYEGNLLALAQLLDRLKQAYPDNGQLTASQTLPLIHDVAHFTAWQWVDSLLLGDSERALHILRQLIFQGSEPLLLVRALQNELLLLIDMQRQATRLSMAELFDKYKVWQSRRHPISQALERVTPSGVRQAVYQLARLERELKGSILQENVPLDSLIGELSSLTLLICGLPTTTWETDWHNF